MANVPIPNLAAPLAAVLLNSATGAQMRWGGADVANPVTMCPNISAPTAVVLFDTVSQALYRG